MSGLARRFLAVLLAPLGLARMLRVPSIALPAAVVLFVPASGQLCRVPVLPGHWTPQTGSWP